MKKSIILILSLVLVSIFAVGCSMEDDIVVDTATTAPVATVENTIEPTTEATMEAPIVTETDDNSTVTEEATEETAE